MFQALQSAEFHTAELASYSPWLTYKLEAWAIFVVFAVVSMAAASALYYRHQARSVRLAIVSLWLILPVKGVINVVAIAVTLPTGMATPMVSATLLEVVEGVIVAGGWTAYLLISKRVKNTYYRHSY